MNYTKEQMEHIEGIVDNLDLDVEREIESALSGLADQIAREVRDIVKEKVMEELGNEDHDLSTCVCLQCQERRWVERCRVECVRRNQEAQAVNSEGKEEDGS